MLNERCVLRTEDEHRVLLVSGVPVAHYAVGDCMAEAYAMVCLVEQGWATQVEVSGAFDCDVRTVRRHQRRFDEGGLAALGRPGGYPRGRPRVAGDRRRRVSQLKAAGIPTREIARRLGVCENAIRKTLRQLGWKPQAPEQLVLVPDAAGAHPNLSGPTAPPGARGQEGSAAAAHPNLSASARSSEAASGATTPAGADPNLSASPPPDDADVAPPSFDRDPADRRLDRFFAYLGLLDDAAPLFQSGAQVPGAGVLLAVPALVQSGVFTVARDIYGSLGPAFYGLRTSVLALLLMALLRIKRPEGLKEHPPADLGRALGLDRAPEVKTLRRKLRRLAARGRAADFGRALAQRRVAQLGAALGFLYVDGHVRAYHGQHALPKAHVARVRLSLPATTDYWVNDQRGDPLFLVTAEANAGLCKMLPTILDQVRALVGERRITIVFDRGGYSPKLFRDLIAAGFDVLTYRKGQCRKVPRRDFTLHEADLDGQHVAYRLADHGVRLLGGRLRLRQVTRLSDDGTHQTPILTSRRDLTTVEVAHYMFERWRQENFFKYLGDEYALDALVEYDTVPDDAAREVPNPAWAKLDAQLKQARAELQQAQAQYGIAAFANPERQRRTMRGFKIAHGQLGHEVWDVFQRVARLQRRRDATPRRVPVGAVAKQPVVKLAPERQLLCNVLKMVAYQAESELARLLAPHYRRAEDEGRTLIQTALAATATLDVSDTELRVRLAPLSQAHRTRAIAALCDELNRTPTYFPGTRLRLRYAVAEPP